MLVIPATQEAEAGELPEPRRRRLQWAEIVPLHSSLGNESETPSQKKEKEKKKENSRTWTMFQDTYVMGNNNLNVLFSYGSILSHLFNKQATTQISPSVGSDVQNNITSFFYLQHHFHSREES